MQESPYYTPEQAAIILQKHPDTVRRLCQRGKIEGARKIGGEWLIPRATIDPFPPTTQKPAPSRSRRSTPHEP
ncbi:MAG: helix-turn-helix domain-containing protein [Ktedonobacteraceae bacterium]|nr:helix-turn-helix domain-containing protein [Ktedonobacteraceae bacterium]